MIFINPREVAAEIIVNITKEGMYNNIALRKGLKQNGAMQQKDRAFVTELVNGTLRNIFFIDYVINGVSKIRTEKMKPWILSVLRSGVYQIEFMNIPKRAAVDEAVKIVKKRGLGSLSNFVNAVLRNVPENAEDIELPNAAENPAEYLSVKYSHPLWLVKMWLSQFEYKFVKDLCKANCEPAQIAVTVNSLKTTPLNLKEILESKGVETKLGKYFENTLYISKFGDLNSLDEFGSGLFHIQDESSALSVAILSPQKGETILDMCSAPGGKSFLIAELMNNCGRVVSRDIFEHKLELIDESASRLGIDIIETELKDASTLYDEDIEKYDKVLVDAPCSGFGLMRKKPDIRINRSGEDIDELVKVQRKILSTAAEYVKEGGTLVYSTCTVCKKENLGNVKWFLENFNFEPVELSHCLPETISKENNETGTVSLFPNVHGTDGFFIACLKKGGKHHEKN